MRTPRSSRRSTKATASNDEFARARQHGAHRRTEAFGEINPRRVEEPGPLAGGDTAGDHGIHEARPVEVGGQSMSKL
jgi:hypothetical protein